MNLKNAVFAVFSHGKLGNFSRLGDACVALIIVRLLLNLFKNVLTPTREEEYDFIVDCSR